MSTPAIHCPGCGQLVEEAKYPEHVKSNHELHKIEIKGAGTVLIPNTQGPKMLDIPYLGRLRRDAFFAWTFFCILLGVLMGARII